MDVAILIVAVLALFVSTGTFCLVALNRRGNQPEPEEQTAESYHEGLVAVPAQGLKYHEPPTEALFAIAGRPQPPFPPPMVGDETLKQWMIHRHNVDSIWARFVYAFYIRAASHHKVRPLFEGKDINDIKKKFLATLLIMCDKGVSEPAAAGLVKLHAHLNISEDAYNATMDALEVTLVEYQVPEDTIAQFVPMIDYFRDEMTVTA